MVGELKKTDPFYKEKRWQRLRMSVMRRDEFMCQDAKRYGRMIPADMVHHIFPRDIFPEYQWEPWNLIALSNKAHEEMHIRNSRELTDKGKDLLIRTARKRGMDLLKIENRFNELRSEHGDGLPSGAGKDPAPI